MDIYGYQRHMVNTTITWVFTILSLGLVRLAFHWWPHIELYSTHRQCALKNAEKLLIVERPKTPFAGFHVVKVKTLKTTITTEEMRKSEFNGKGGSINSNKSGGTESLPLFSEENIVDLTSVKMFELKKQRYIWDNKTVSFVKLKGLENVPSDNLHNLIGLSPSKRKVRSLLYGENKITVPVQGVLELIILDVLNPFYIFQIFSFCLWLAYEYISYAVAIVIMSAFSIIMTVIQTRDNQKKLHSTIHSSDMVSVVQVNSSQETEICTIPAEQLVPGDVILLPSHGCTMCCDAALLTGSCVVNESILTGESVPVTKIPVPNSPTVMYNSKDHWKHTLYCGTRMIKTHSSSEEDIYAVVVQTGFSTVKGELVRSILYPAPISFKFEEDSYKFMQLMSVFAGFGFLYTVITKMWRGIPTATTALEALDLVTIVVPPSLPAAMAVGCMSAQARLRDKNIFCVSPRMINVSGCIDCVCFDKTGTLTEDGLDLWGVLPLRNNSFDSPVQNVNLIRQQHILQAMATCHTLCAIEGQLCGDPLDIKMFEWTNWTLEEPSSSCKRSSHIIVIPSSSFLDDDLQEIEIIHQLPFSSSLQRMTVVTRPKRKENGGDYSCFTIYSKGSPEVIRDLCNPHSIPNDFERKLEEYTMKSCRVLGMAYKNEHSYSDQLSREEIENELNFLGLIIFENRLKPRTAEVIKTLQTANIRTVMVTGDNQLTAVGVARECGIVSPREEVFSVSVIQPRENNPAHLRYKLCGEGHPSCSVQTTSGDHETKHETSKKTNVESHSAVSEGLTSISHLDITSTTNMTLALTGTTWDSIQRHLPAEVATVAKRCAVFARMTPDQKQQLVLCLQSLGYYVGMCGDGANDCGALKAAHAGISLSEAESSVASPFTSRESTVDCVIKVIQEGRAALVTSLSIFKFMAGYSITQFLSVMILYSIDSNLTDMQYLFVDLFIISVFAFLLGRTEAHNGPLAPLPPDKSLLSPTTIASLIGQVTIVILFQFICYFSLLKYDWFVPYNSTKPNYKGPGCLENYALFVISAMQYVILAVVFCKGAPYRKPLSKNWSLWTTAACVTSFVFYLILWPDEWLQDMFELVMPPDINFRIFCITLCVVNFIIAGIYEFYFCDVLLSNKLRSTQIINPKKEKDI